MGDVVEISLYFLSEIYLVFEFVGNYCFFVEKPVQNFVSNLTLLVQESQEIFPA